MSELFTDQLVELDFEISEMVSDPGQIVSLNKVRVQELLDEYADDNPQFPVLRIEAGGTSRNGNHWPDSILGNIAEQINLDEKPGYWGHIKPEDRGYVFPDPETLWLGATVKQEGGKPVLYVKGYNLPGSRARRHKSLAKMTSWAGRASGKVINGVRMIEKYALESIDWARPGAAGMDARVVAIATEMEGSENTVDWSKVTLAEIERENPSLFALMKEKAEGELSSTVSEMEEKANKADAADTTFSQIREILGIDEKTDIVEAIADVHERVDNLSRKTLMDKVTDLLTGKIKDERARATVVRLMPVTEMEGLSDEDLAVKVDEVLSSDDDIKAVITEMEQAPAPLHSRQQPGNSSGVGKSGMVTVGATKL